MRLRYVALFPVIESISCQSLWRKQRATTGGSLSLNASDSPSAIDAASNHQVGTLERRTYVSRASCSEAGAEMIDLALGEVVEWTRWAWLALSEHRDPFEAMAVRQILGHPTPDEEVRAKNRYAMIEREARLLTRGSTLIDCLDPTGRCSSAPEVEGYVDTQLSRIHLVCTFSLLYSAMSLSKRYLVHPIFRFAGNPANPLRKFTSPIPT